jgi:uncharacterized glyoxalase superfamily protein PhnB
MDHKAFTLVLDLEDTVVDRKFHKMIKIGANVNVVKQMLLLPDFRR